MSQGLAYGSEGEESTLHVGHLGLILRFRRSLGGGHGDPLQYSCLETPHGQRSLAGYIHGVSTTQTRLSHWPQHGNPCPKSSWCWRRDYGRPWALHTGPDGDGRPGASREVWQWLWVAWHVMWSPRSSHQGMHYPPLIPLWVLQDLLSTWQDSCVWCSFGCWILSPWTSASTSSQCVVSRWCMVLDSKRFLSLKKGRSYLYIQWNATWS